MKKVALTLIALVMTGIAVLVGAPAAYAYPNCYHQYCQWVVNPGFENASSAPWVKSPGVTVLSDNLCGRNTKVAQMQRIPESKPTLYQQMYINDAFAGPQAQVEFKLELRNDQNSFYDHLRVTVKNLDTNASETLNIHGSGFNTDCSQPAQVWNLVNDYGGHNVELKFEVNSPFATGTFVLDDIYFWTY